MKQLIFRMIKKFKIACCRRKKRYLSEKYTVAIQDIRVNPVTINSSYTCMKKLNKAWKESNQRGKSTYQERR